ncbi:MAG: MarR family transcriptional regulator [Gemmatimonadetes bacterium]|nr:MarR family transcriptional regulator [Gemmatimonadota bacterium]NIO30285.1 MarR family transcriptional regulator [Gemmatimonadota bacterium]
MTAARTAATDPALDRDAAAFYDALADLIRVYQFRDRDRICCQDISVTQYYALESLARHGPLTLNELASQLYLDKSTVSRVVTAIERKKLLHRQPHEQDRRAVHLALTDTGRRLYDAIRGDIEEREKRLIADFDPETRGAMIALIGRLAQAAKGWVSTDGGRCCSLE